MPSSSLPASLSELVVYAERSRVARTISGETVPLGQGRHLRRLPKLARAKAAANAYGADAAMGAAHGAKLRKGMAPSEIREQIATDAQTRLAKVRGKTL